MPVIEETDAHGEIRRRFVAQTTSDRRRDRAIRAVLRRAGTTRVDPDLYARVWDACARVSDPEAVALVYLAETARAQAERIYGHRPEALATAAGQITRARAALNAKTDPVPLSLPAGSRGEQ